MPRWKSDAKYIKVFNTTKKIQKYTLKNIDFKRDPKS